MKSSPMRSVAQLKNLPLEEQTKVLKIHEETFKDSACKTCDGNCCERCGPAKGYFSTRMPQRTFEELAAKYAFTEENGFRGETGCKLPIVERNDICLSFMCSGIALEGRDPKLGRYGPKTTKVFTDKQRENGFAIVNAFWVKK